MVDCLQDQLIPAGESPGNQETSRWDPTGHADNRPWITFLTRELFMQNIFISNNKYSICFQILCYSHCVRHVCFGINGLITAQLSNGPWQRSAWDRLIPPPPLLHQFTFPYINWPITEREKTSSGSTGGSGRGDAKTIVHHRTLCSVI